MTPEFDGDHWEYWEYNKEWLQQRQNYKNNYFHCPRCAFLIKCYSYKRRVKYFCSNCYSEGTIKRKSYNFKKIVFPKIRKVECKLLAQEIVSVQPMTIPSGLLFWIEN